jgi:hypothetical protein
MQPVLADWPAEREGELLVVDRHHPVQHRVGRIEAAVAEVAAHRAREPVRSRLGHRNHLHGRRSPHRRVEAVRDVLELANRFLAVPRLVAEAHFRGDLLTVEAELILPHVARGAAIGDRRVRRIRGHSAAGREHRERHPVAALHGQLLHLLRVDVAAKLRRRDVDQRRFAADRHGFRHAARRHLQVDDERLPDEHLHAAPLRGAESLQLRGDLIAAHSRGDAVDAALVGDGDELVAGRLMENGDGDARQDRAGGIGDGAREHGLLRKCSGRNNEGQSCPLLRYERYFVELTALAS